MVAWPNPIRPNTLCSPRALSLPQPAAVHQPWRGQHGGSGGGCAQAPRWRRCTGSSPGRGHGGPRSSGSGRRAWPCCCALSSLSHPSGPSAALGLHAAPLASSPCVPTPVLTCSIVVTHSLNKLSITRCQSLIVSQSGIAYGWEPLPVRFPRAWRQPLTRQRRARTRPPLLCMPPLSLAPGRSAGTATARQQQVLRRHKQEHLISMDQHGQQWDQRPRSRQAAGPTGDGQQRVKRYNRSVLSGGHQQN